VPRLFARTRIKDYWYRALIEPHVVASTGVEQSEIQRYMPKFQVSDVPGQSLT
jgi:hypothetical protein